MKIIVPVVIILLSWTAGLFADTESQLISDLDNVISGAVSPISIEMAKHMGYYTGSGNVSPVNTSGDFSMKFGLAAGLNTTDILTKILKGEDVFSNTTTNPMTNYFNLITTTVSIAPLPYDEAYFKLGLPALPMDVGLRIGLIPSTSISTGTGSTISFSQFHIGAEGRYVLWSFLDIIKVDGRLSVDYDGGNISYSYSGSDIAYLANTNVGTNSYNVNFAFNWGGVSIGAKVMGGLNIPFLGGPFIGIGLNYNLGSVTSSIAMNDNFTPLIGSQISLPQLQGSSQVNYNPFDMRLIVGIRILILDAALEYGILNNDLAWTVGMSYVF
jgi:hypothetical protein